MAVNISMLADAKEYTCNDKHTQFIIISKIVPHTHTNTHTHTHTNKNNNNKQQDQKAAWMRLVTSLYSVYLGFSINSSRHFRGEQRATSVSTRVCKICPNRCASW